MRILLVLEACGGGAARHVADLAEGLLAAGHNVSLIYSPLRADAWFIDEITQSKELDGWMSFEAVASRYEDPSSGSFTTTTT